MVLTWEGPRVTKWFMHTAPGSSRRHFFKQLGAATPALILGLPTAAAGPTGRSRRARARELRADVVVIGGGLGGCAAALAAARQGLQVILTEETDWIGGQLTAQAVPPDENPWVEDFGATRSYQVLRRGIREYYRRNYPLTAAAKRTEALNPGNGWVSRLCCEPRVALAVLEELLAPHTSGHRVRILRRCRAQRVQVNGDWVEAVEVDDSENGHQLILHADWFIDATETGDLLPLARAEHVTGAESRRQTGEPHAPDQAQPDNHQAFTCCFAMDHMPGEDHAIDRPADYAYWRDYVPKLRPPWPGRLLAWEYSDPITLRPKKVETDPDRRTGLWVYRRIADRDQFEPGAYPGDLSLVNWPQNDFLEGNLYGVSPGRAAKHLRAAKNLSLSLLYWLQHDAPRPDGGTGWKGLRLRRDIVGTEDGLAKMPYVRESRRIQAEFTVLEQHVSSDIRAAELAVPIKEARAVPFQDSVGIGYYRIDLHPSTGGDNYLDVGALPFQIPLGALTPVRLENLLPGAKNLGVTHITNGCYRLHPVEWNIGEASGLLATFCLLRKKAARAVRATPTLLAEFQQLLQAEGLRLEWPRHVSIG